MSEPADRGQLARDSDPAVPADVPGLPDPAGPEIRLAAFSISRLPRIVFGSGRLRELPAIVAGYGARALVITRPSLRATPIWEGLTEGFHEAGVQVLLASVSGEPSPSLVDGLVSLNRDEAIDVVVGIGGGSVLDTSKAVAGLLRPGNSVMDHLEGVGPELPYRGPALPLVAVPTTAGTGSEATKNAVLSVRGAGGFKKSFRDERLVAEIALVDPDLLATCPPDVIAADGMDAVTQLLEAYVSSKATPFTDALALSGLAAARDALVPWFEMASARTAPAAPTTPSEEGSDGDLPRGGAGSVGNGDRLGQVQEAMAYAALCSGICLAQAGLGAVHGIASPLGAFFPVPHGVACGAVLAPATSVNVAALEAREPGNGALPRYAALGRLLARSPGSGDGEARAALVALLDSWRARLSVPRLSAYGIAESDIAGIVAESRGSSMRTNPIRLTDTEIAAILRASL